MQEEKEKILENVFISASENKLQLCDLFFNNKIKQIIPKTGRLFEWKEIKDNSQIEVLKRQYPLIKNRDASIDGGFLLAIPGAIDPHVHFNTPGFEYRDTFKEGSFAAACGGVTAIIDMPCTSIPPVTTLNGFQTKYEAVKDSSNVDFAFWGGIANEGLNEITVEKNIIELAEAGVAGFKAYMISGMETFKDLSDEKLKLSAQYVKKTGKPLAVHAEDKEIIKSAAGKYSADDLKKWESYCGIRSVLAEAQAVLKLANISNQTGCKIHIVHLSSQAGLDIIKNAKNKGISINAETCPHYLFFTQNSFNDNSIRNYLKTAPPVKFESDKEALWNGLCGGSISFTATDHAGCDPLKEKSSSNFNEVYGGIPGVEHRVPFLLSEGWLKDKLNLEQTINLLSSNAAEYFGFKAKGYLKKDFDADIALIDLWSSEVISGSNMHSKGKYTPFEGVKFNAVVKKTFLRGNLIMDKLSPLNNTNNSPNKNYLGRFIYV